MIVIVVVVYQRCNAKVMRLEIHIFDGKMRGNTHLHFILISFFELQN